MSSSISSSETPDPWRRFFRALVLSSLALGGVIYLFIAIVDPFDTLNLSPPFDRSPVETNARFAHPALARNRDFDSMILGTSSSRLLRPAELNPLFRARFVNLAMNAATAYEQWRLGSVFVRAHPDAKVALIGLDLLWCQTGESVAKYTPRPFPEWMYDDDPWNDYAEIFNLYAVEQAGIAFATLTGLRPERYGRDGYTNFLPDDATYDAARARAHLYPAGRSPPAAVEAPVEMSAAERRALVFPSLPMLQDLLARLPQARKVVFFVPYHVSVQPPPGSREALVLAECKARVGALVAAAPRARLVDFMIPSPVTERDANYWDPLHYRVAIATWLGQSLRAALDGPPRRDPSGYVVLRGAE